MVAEKILEKSNESQNHVSNSHSWADFEGEKKKKERKVSPENFRMSIMIQTHVKEKNIIYIYGIDFLRNKTELIKKKTVLTRQRHREKEKRMCSKFDKEIQVKAKNGKQKKTKERYDDILSNKREQRKDQVNIT